jgi:hypothetical protein
LADRSALHWEGFSANRVTRSLDMGLVEQPEKPAKSTGPEAIRELAPRSSCKVVLQELERLYAEGRIGMLPYHYLC